MIKIGVTGGIGSGKSTLCRMLAERGAALYDSDLEARRLMNGDGELRRRIVAAFGPESYTDEGLNRPWLAGRVFSDPGRLQLLNGIVHPAVKADFRRRAERCEAKCLVLESAILFPAGLDAEVDRTVAVLAPEPLRVERTCRRDGVDAAEVRRRMAAQMSDDELAARADYTVVNILEADLEAAADQLCKLFLHGAAVR